jgi:hypothetical protein
MNLIKKSLTTFLLLLVLVGTCIGQETETETKFKNRFGIGLTLGGPAWLISMDFNYFVTKELNIEVGGGLRGLYAGLRYYTKPNKSLNPYIGIQYAYSLMPDMGGSYNWESWLYLPLGFPIVFSRNFSITPELALTTRLTQRDLPTFLWGALKFRFSL